ncbi:MAG: EamA family transporter [Oceanicaulis sp.]
MDEIAPIAALAALCSAMAHSVMALFTKRAGDTLVFRAVTLSLSALWLSPLLMLTPFPGWEVWRFLLISAALIWAFNMLMIGAFRRGDMNLVYPVMRGAAPALAGLFAFAALGEALSPLAVAGLALASATLIAFAWPERGGAPKLSALGFALGSAVMTASYTVTDAAGVRAADSTLQYLAWFFAVSVASIAATALIRRRAAFWPAARAEFKGAFFSSFFNIATYGLALFAYANAPVAPMAALRETSIVFGAILAALVLKEPFGLRRGVLALILAAGLSLLQLA